MPTWISILLAFILSAIATGLFLGIVVTIYTLTMSCVQVFTDWLLKKLS